MPLDFRLIDESTSYSLERVREAKPSVCPYIYTLRNFLSQPLLTKLLNHLIEYNAWDEIHRHPGRKEIIWEADTVVEEVFMVMSSLTPAVNDLLLTNHNKFLGINLWKDSNPFTVPRHTDNPIIGTSIQIYLNSCDVDLTTKFLYGDTVINLDYISNSGYMMNNDFRAEHWMYESIPMDFKRYSLYATWGIE